MRIKRLFFFLLTSHFSKAYLGEAKTLLVGTRKDIYYVWACNKIQHRRLYIKSFNGTIYMYISLKCNIIQRNIIKINMNSRGLIKKNPRHLYCFPGCQFRYSAPSGVPTYFHIRIIHFFIVLLDITHS